MGSNYSLANKIHWQTIRRLSKKRLSTTTLPRIELQTFLGDKKKILSRWKEYFEDLLNPVKETPIDTCEKIDFGEEAVFTITEVAVAIIGLKSGKPDDEDEIRSKMLKTLNGGVRTLTRASQMA